MSAFLLSRIRALQIHTSSLETIALLAQLPYTHLHTLHLKNVPHHPAAVEPLRALVAAAPSLRHVLLDIDPAATLLGAAGSESSGSDSEGEEEEGCPLPPTICSGRAAEYWTVQPDGSVENAAFEDGERVMAAVGL